MTISILRKTTLRALAALLLLGAAACGDDSGAASGSDGSPGFGPNTNAPAGNTSTTGSTGTTGTGDPTATSPGSAGNGADTPPNGTDGTDNGTATDGATCPASAPMDGSACTSMGFMECAYDSGDCQCFRESWRCEAPADPNCPGMRPDDGTTCDVAGTSCRYRRTACECAGGEWSCDGQMSNQDPDQDGGVADAQCPASEPADDSDCSAANATTCDYGQNSCSCFGGAWRC